MSGTDHIRHPAPGASYALATICPPTRCPVLRWLVLHRRSLYAMSGTNNKPFVSSDRPPSDVHSSHFAHAFCCRPP
eukprot:3616467-Rhodomonas_salina.1